MLLVMQVRATWYVLVLFLIFLKEHEKLSNNVLQKKKISWIQVLEHRNE